MFFRIASTLLLLVGSVGGKAWAAPQDGFVLTQWGQWTREEAVQAIDGASKAGARHVSILLHMCQASKSANEIGWCEAGPGESLRESYQGQRILKVIPEIRARGMSVSLIPFPGSPDLSSRQWIFPANPFLWFRSYGDHLVELAHFANEVGVTDFIVGSELTLLFTQDWGWRWVIQRVREVYRGHITISAVFPQYPVITFWDALDSIGVSAYFPLAVTDRVSPTWALQAAWLAHKQHLTAFAILHGKPLTFVEVGYPATNVAASMPWDYQWSKRKIDYGLQARCFEAFRRVWADEPLLRRFQIWGLSAQPFEAEKGFSPIGKAAEDPVRRLFSRRGLL